MGDIIQVDHDGLEDIAKKFKNESEAVAQMYRAIQQSMQRLKPDWLGRGSDAFFSEMEKEILPAVQRLIDALAIAADTTNQIKGLMQNADQEASSPFTNSDAGGSSSGLNGAGANGGGGSAGGLDGGLVGAGNDYGIPKNWLSGVTDSLKGYMQNNSNDFGIPKDWLSGVTAGLQDSAGAEAGSPAEAKEAGGGGSGGGSGGGGSESGGGSSGGGSGGSEPSSPTTTPETLGAGGGGGSFSPQSEFHSPYGQGGGFSSGFGGGGSGAAGDGSVAPADKFPYQAFGGGGGGGGSGVSPGSAGTPGSSSGGGGGQAAPQAGGGFGLPFGLAAISPFIALLGKAIKDNKSDN